MVTASSSRKSFNSVEMVATVDSLSTHGPTDNPDCGAAFSSSDAGIGGDNGVGGDGSPGDSHNINNDDDDLHTMRVSVVLRLNARRLTRKRKPGFMEVLYFLL